MSTTAEGSGLVLHVNLSVRIVEEGAREASLPGKTAEMARPDTRSAIAWALERQRTVGYSEYSEWIFSHRKVD